MTFNQNAQKICVDIYSKIFAYLNFGQKCFIQKKHALYEAYLCGCFFEKEKKRRHCFFFFFCSLLCLIFFCNPLVLQLLFPVGKSDVFQVYFASRGGQKTLSTFMVESFHLHIVRQLHALIGKVREIMLLHLK